MGAFRPGAGPGVSEFRFVGWSRAPAAEPAENSQFQPWFFDARSAVYRREPGVGGIRCAARAEFPRRTACSREGAAGRRIRSVCANGADELWKLLFNADYR